jgi:hypothetical protein
MFKTVAVLNPPPIANLDQGSFILRKIAFQRGSPWRFLISGSTVMGGIPIMIESRC